MKSYLVATIRDWNLRAFERSVQALPGDWHLISRQEDLTESLMSRLQPRYIFFPHWSWRIPESIYTAFECVLFHMTDLPYGRGGSPLQNLIERGHTETVLAALQVTDGVDEGPIYSKKPLSLEGTAAEIFERAAGKTFEMISQIVREEPKPRPQHGEITTFRRRTPDMSELSKEGELSMIFDQIRMLDAEGYPRAFIDHGSFRITFGTPISQIDYVEAKVRIERRRSKG